MLLKAQLILRPSPLDELGRIELPFVANSFAIFLNWTKVGGIS